MRPAWISFISRLQFGRLSAQENAEAALVPLRAGMASGRREPSRPLSDVGLGDRLRHLPSELPGGRQQRLPSSAA